jgi:hypothetical protein
LNQTARREDVPRDRNCGPGSDRQAVEVHANNFALRHAARALARFPVTEFHWRAGINGLRRVHAAEAPCSGSRDDDGADIDKPRGRRSSARRRSVSHVSAASNRCTRGPAAISCDDGARLAERTRPYFVFTHVSFSLRIETQEHAAT